MRLRRGCRGWWIALLAALADRLTKLLAAKLPAGRRALIPGVLNLRPVGNRGMAFSMLSGQSVEDRGRFRFNGRSGSLSRFTVEDSGRVTADYVNHFID